MAPMSDSFQDQVKLVCIVDVLLRLETNVNSYISSTHKSQAGTVKENRIKKEIKH